MKPSLFILCFLILSSCKKEAVKTHLSGSVQNETSLKNKKQFQISKSTDVYADKIFNTCLNEYVNLTGTVTYFTKESFDNGYYLNYTIDLKKVTGLGELSGIRFHGGGKIVGKVWQSEDGLNEKARVFYKVSYVSSGGNHMGFIQKATFIIKNGEVKVDFNNSSPTCE
ncbi:MAG: hypothetical protein ABIO55_03100 [Ginsengibacter sp.]